MWYFRGRGGMIQRPIASVKPMVSTPVPMRPKIVAAPQILKPGVSVHQVLTTTGQLFKQEVNAKLCYLLVWLKRPSCSFPFTFNIYVFANFA